MILADILNEDVFEVIESYYDRIGLAEEERAEERIRFGLALISHTQELFDLIVEERNEHGEEIEW